MTAVAVDVLLAAAVLTAWLGAAALLLLRDSFDRLHAIGFVTIASGLFVTLAVIVHAPFSPLALKQIVLFVAAIGIGGVLAHSIARALRIRDQGADRP